MRAHARAGSFRQELTGTMCWEGANQTFAFHFFDIS